MTEKAIQEIWFWSTKVAKFINCHSAPLFCYYLYKTLVATYLHALNVRRPLTTSSQVIELVHL